MATMKFTMRAGAGVRGSLRSAVKATCFLNDIRILHFEEIKRFFGSTFLIEVEAEPTLLQEFGEWMDSLSDPV